MASSLLNLENYSIPLEEINLATDNFNPQRCIGGGGFGYVYRGQLSKHWQNRIVAIKRLAKDGYQGEREFRNEVEKISGFHHENIISFVGYCDEENEMIIVCEYATNGSLDHHLKDQNKMCCLTWIQRLKISLEAASGLNYLHAGRGEHKSVIHRDIKSANILLDDNMVAKICDFGLSKSGPKSQTITHIYTKVAGTQYYIDPTYIESRILRKESDIYSLGVVLFEMLTGMLVYRPRRIGEDKTDSLIKLVRKYYPKELDKLIDPDINDQISSRSFDTFKKIAWQCISYDFKKRPALDMVMKKIQEALDIQLQENVSAFFESIEKDSGFNHGKPVPAFTIYKLLLHRNYIEAEKTMVLERLFQIFVSENKYQKSNPRMAYWLSCAYNLLFLIQKSLKLDGASSVQEPPPSTFLLREMITADDEILHQIELRVLLASAIQEPRMFQEPTSSKRSFHEDYRFSDWHGILDRLNTFLSTMKKNYVAPIVVQRILAQVFSYINVQLFNSLLWRWEYCSFRNGEFVKVGLAELELWCSQSQGKYAGLAWDELKHIRQAVEFLVKHNKHLLTYDEITNLCPILSIPQLHRICTIYRDLTHSRGLFFLSFEHVTSRRLWMRENSSFIYSYRLNDSPFYVVKYFFKILFYLILYTIFKNFLEDSHHVSSDVIIMMKIWMKEHSNINYRLNDSSRQAFSVDDLYTSLQVDDFANINPTL
ncbi:unnamed protein product [Lactuca virosa]|uniref:non-specific serine/threonine protein kinase n=1 Tax=Lactuca virosa TaxID=75947 RepID=A0AAU9NSI8_9ASTR|nr:unnamed protein product [Lactuca virosa]